MYKLCLLVFKCLNGIGPEYLVDLLHTSSSSRTTRLSCDKTRLQCVNTRLCTMGDRAFSAIAPKMWNDLDVCIREAETVNLFKSKLKTHFFKKAFKQSLS